MDINPSSRLFTALPEIPDAENMILDLRKIIESRWLSNRGPYVQKFEKEIADYLKHPSMEVVSCANATVGLEATLKVLGIRGKVILSPFTFVSTAHSIRNAGLDIVFADIDPVTFCLSPESVESLVSSEVSAIVPVHVYGNLCDTEAFDQFRSKGIKIIYDSAHAFGVKRAGVCTGASGDAEVFSFHATKILSACEGGAVTTLDSDLAEKIRLHSNFGITSETEVEMIGSNAKMSEVHALFGLYSLRGLDRSISIRRSMTRHYRELLEGVAGIEIPAVQKNVESNGQYFPILLENQARRDHVYEELKKENIMSRKYFFPPLHLLKPYQSYAHPKLKTAEQVSSRILCLPLHSLMDTSQVEIITNRIKSLF